MPTGHVDDMYVDDQDMLRASDVDVTIADVPPTVNDDCPASFATCPRDSLSTSQRANGMYRAK